MGKIITNIEKLQQEDTTILPTPLLANINFLRSENRPLSHYIGDGLRH